jgi:hypothetical protein
MEKRNKAKFLKNRTWKSKCRNRLKGRASEVIQDFDYGLIDRLIGQNSRIQKTKGS